MNAAADRGAARGPVGVAAATVLLLVLTLVALVAGGAAAAPTTSARPAYPNGQLPPSALVQVGGIQLQPDAGHAYARLLAAAAEDGVTVAATDGYRSYERQVRLKAEKGWLAARPGTSMHGWGLAIDFDMRRTDFAWLRANAATYGWVHPPWAQPGGSKPEPWHWEYAGPTSSAARSPAAGSLPPGERSAPRRVPTHDLGELIAYLRAEPTDADPGEWFVVRAGLAGLDVGPRHYPGTAVPGRDGNFAVAGYRDEAASAYGAVLDLGRGDLVRVRDATGDEHLYQVVERAVLSDVDGWAVGPQPLGPDRGPMATFTGGAGAGALQVVWAERLEDEGLDADLASRPLPLAPTPAGG